MPKVASFIPSPVTQQPEKKTIAVQLAMFLLMSTVDTLKTRSTQFNRRFSGGSLSQSIRKPSCWWPRWPIDQCCSSTVLTVQELCRSCLCSGSQTCFLGECKMTAIQNAHPFPYLLRSLAACQSLNDPTGWRLNKHLLTVVLIILDSCYTPNMGTPK